MEISEKLLQYKLHILFVLTLILMTLFVAFIPRFLTILAYFWPLFLSTALFLFAVIVFGRTSVPSSDASGESKTGEGLLHYVAGQSDHPVESFKSEE
ncbi:hypothetical protein SLA2020_352160 [Shorea laevis]